MEITITASNTPTNPNTVAEVPVRFAVAVLTIGIATLATTITTTTTPITNDTVPIVIFTWY